MLPIQILPVKLRVGVPSLSADLRAKYALVTFISQARASSKINAPDDEWYVCRDDPWNFIIGAYIRKQSSQCQASRRAKYGITNRLIYMSISVIYDTIEWRRGINKSVKKHVLSRIQNWERRKNRKIQDALFLLFAFIASMPSHFTHVDNQTWKTGHFICKFSAIYIASAL